jgi:hypothetical protein
MGLGLQQEAARGILAGVFSADTGNQGFVLAACADCACCFCWAACACLIFMALSPHCCNFAFLKQLHHINAFTPAWHCCFSCVSADNISGTHTTSTRYGASSDAAPAQRLLALAWEHAEELFGQRVATDWHNAWQHGSGPVGVAGAPGMSGGSMFGVYKQKAR